MVLFGMAQALDTLEGAAAALAGGRLPGEEATGAGAREVAAGQQEEEQERTGRRGQR